MTLIDPQLGTKKLPLAQTAPGRYVADFETPLSGPYHLELTQKVNGQVLYQQSRGISVGYSDELRLKPTNEKLLTSIAEASGGKHRVNAAEVFTSTGRTARRPTPLWPWLITAAVLLLVLDVGLRRIDLGLALGRRPSVSNSGRPSSTIERQPKMASSRRAPKAAGAP
jgi:Ca-activated chloride channel family protein